jgi:hypothetical protein
MPSLLVPGRLNADDPNSDLGGYRVQLTYRTNAAPPGDGQREALVDVAQNAAVAPDGTFTLSLPDGDAVRPPIAIDAFTPRGDLAGHRDPGDNLPKRIELDVQPPDPVVLQRTEDPLQGRQVKLLGRALEATGRRQISATQIVIFGVRAVGDAPQPLLATTTDAVGYFSALYPADTLVSAFGHVGIGKGIDVPIPLEKDRLPTRVLLVVDLKDEAEAGTQSESHDCACEADVPRAPDQEELVTQSSTYSSDLGGGRCVDFTTPNRTLEEHSFYTVVRTTEPVIKGFTLSPPGPVHPHIRDLIAGLLRPDGVIRRLAPAPDDGEAHGVNIASNPHTAASNLEIGKLRLDDTAVRELVRSSDSLSVRKVIDADYGTRIREVGRLVDVAVPAPPARAELDIDHAVDWDSSPTVYQAVTIAHGHLLHFKQVWRADGYSLGDLLYSLPLAPLQKKQIVVIDFDRREEAAKTQMLEEEEALQNLLTRDRDIGEVVNSVLRESMHASSSSWNWGVGGGSGAAGSGTLGAFSIGAVLGYSAGGGGAHTSADQNSSRDLSASSLQELRDRTQQASSAVRSQRATVVQTLRQGEALSVQSEVVANHNHCHAVTVEYFEVLRHLQVSQELTDVQECLFVPLPMSRFDAAKARRWREALARSLRDRTLLPAFDAVERRETNYAGTDLPTGRFADESIRWLDGELRLRFKLVRPQDKLEQDVVEASRRLDTTLWSFYAPFLWLGLSELESQYFLGRLQAERDRIFHAEIAPRIAEAFVNQLEFSLVGSGGAQDIPLDATLVSEYRPGADLYVSLRPAGSLGSLPPRAAVERVEIRTPTPLPPDSKATLVSGSMRYRTRHMSHFLFRDWRIENDLMPGDDVQVPTDLDSEELRNPHDEDLRLEQQLLAHLNEHFEYYHKAIWWLMDPDRRFMLLDGFIAPDAGGRSVASVVENRLIGIIGNCLVMPVARGFHLDPTYKQEAGNAVDLLEHYAPASPIPPMRISLPTRGVFAEAVMGSCNSCEEKDETRFWRFEESPDPDNPTPLQPVSTESRRAEPPNLEPTPLPPPVVSIQQPPSAPDPTGLAAALQLLSRGDLFRDITGVEGTQRNALAAMQSAMESARYYAGEASKLAQSAQQTQGIDKTMQTIDRAQTSGALTADEAKALKKQAIQRMVGGGDKPSQEDLSAIKSAVADDSVDMQSGKETMLEGLRKRAGLDPSPTGDVTAAIGRRVAAGDGDDVSVSDGTGNEVQFIRTVFSPDSGGGGSGGGTAPGPQAVALFPPTPPTLINLDVTLQTALDTAIAALETKRGIAHGTLRPPFAIIDISAGGGTPAPFAGYKADDMDYIASEAKVSIMFAGYALRDMVRRFAPSSGAATQADLFASLQSTIDPKIKTASAIVAAATNITDVQRVPDYPTLFDAAKTGGTWTIDFTPGFVDSLDRMIIASDNNHAGRCVQAVGYGYMNGAFEACGFFDATKRVGLWEAGDFLDPAHLPSGMTKWPYVRVNSVNDGDVAQAGTACQMARLVALIDSGQVIDAASCTEMLSRLADAAKGRPGMTFDRPWIDRPSPRVIKKASIVANKLGLGPLKAGPSVRSEVTVLDAPLNPGHRYVVAWQDLKGLTPITFGDVATVIRDTIKGYEP